jgi:hypothetical protein
LLPDDRVLPLPSVTLKPVKRNEIVIDMKCLSDIPLNILFHTWINFFNMRRSVVNMHTYKHVGLDTSLEVFCV